MQFKSIIKLLLLLATFLVFGCSTTFQKTDTKLYGGTGRHTGEFYVYRVDDAWQPSGFERGRYHVGDSFKENSTVKQIRQWVPVREKDDISDLDSPDRIVTNEDLVNMSIRQVFVKYFKETGKGEIALVISVSSGDKIRENLIVYASQGQTLGSSLSIDDIRVFGPEKLDGQSVRMRLVLIEVDQVENSAMKDFIKGAAGLASNLQPQNAAVMKIASDVAEYIVSLNKDDIIFDRTFELAMTQSGMTVDTTPLLYGQYIMLLQEDRLQGDDVNKKARISTRPPAVGDMRYNLHAGRLFNSYLYKPIKAEEKEFVLGEKRIDFHQFYPSTLVANTVSIEDLNNDAAKDYRHTALAYPNEDIGDLDVWGNLNRTLAVIYCESIRYSPKESSKGDCVPNLLESEEEKYFHFPVYLYPKGNAIFAQYPFHTHVIFSVSRSIGIEEKPAEERYSTYAEWIEEAQAGSAISSVVDAVKQDMESKALADLTLKKALIAHDQEEKACILAKGILNDKIIIKSPLYNEMFHLTGELFGSEDEAKKYVSENYSSCEVN